MSDKPTANIDSPEWNTLCDAVAVAAGVKLGCPVALLAFPSGGMAFSIGGQQHADAKLSAIMNHPPRFLAFVSDVANAPQEANPLEKLAGKPLEVIVVPGAFDGFTGTAEELAEVLGAFKEAAASGKLHEMAHPMTAADFQEMADQAKATEDELQAQGSTRTRQ